jgi:hypothetical protein
LLRSPLRQCPQEKLAHALVNHLGLPGEHGLRLPDPNINVLTVAKIKAIQNLRRQRRHSLLVGLLLDGG